MLRTVGSIVLGAILCAACGAPAASPSPETVVPTSSVAAPPTGSPPIEIATPSSAPVTTASPAPQTNPSPTLKAVKGWPLVSQREVSMRGRRLDPVGPDGKLVYTVTLRGLAAGSIIDLQTRGRYQVEWACGVEPEPCGDAGCAPLHTEPQQGTVKVTARTTAGPDGVAKARIKLVAPPPEGSCPENPTAPWTVWLSHRWDRIRITDPAHRLILTPEPVVEEDTI